MQDVIVVGGGAASTVRRQWALNFEGVTWPERFIATNAFFDFDRHGYARGTFQVDQDHGAVVAKLDNAGLWRCTYMEDANLSVDSFLERLPRKYAAMLPGTVNYTIDRAAPYKMHQRSAPTYRVGRAAVVTERIPPCWIAIQILAARYS